MQKMQDVQTAANRLKDSLPESLFSAAAGKPVGLILGTGLSDAFSGEGQTIATIPYPELGCMPETDVSSHKGELLCLGFGKLPVFALLGRSHLYEGLAPSDVCAGVRLLAALGCATLIITNAAGALNPLFQAPGLMRICDIINFTGLSPLTGCQDLPGQSRFVDMSAPFAADLGAIADRKALELGIRLERGVYIGVHGPEMETPAETRMYRQWGADAIGMSTCLEVICARHLGLRCLGISCLTNRNLPDCMQPAPIEAVISAAAQMSAVLGRLLTSVLQELAGANARPES